MSATVVTDLSTHFSSRGGQRVRYIVVHTTVSPANSTPRDTRGYLKKNARFVSIHEYVEAAALVVTMVPDHLAAHHCESDAVRLPGGEPGYLANEITWGIEGYQIAGLNVSQGVAAAMLERVVAACRRLNLPASRVYGHREIVAGNYRQDPVGINMDSFRADVAALLAPKPAEEVPKHSKVAREKAAYYAEVLTRALKKQPGALTELVNALVSESVEASEEIAAAIEGVALPPLYEARDR